MNAAPHLSVVQAEQAATHSEPTPPQPASIEWIETPTATRIVATLTMAEAMRDVALIYGAPGVGKSEAASHFCRPRTPAVLGGRGPRVLIAAHPAIGDVVPFLSALCDALRISRKNGAAELHNACAHALSYGVTVLVVDEAQNLTAATLEQIRGLYDETGVAVVLIGSRDLYARIAGGKSAAGLEGLRSRIGRRVQIDASTEGDAAAIAAAWGIGSKPERELLSQICTSAGGLRLALKSLRLASIHALAAGRTRGHTDLATAWRELGGA